jgi:hypothetical protein
VTVAVRRLAATGTCLDGLCGQVTRTTAAIRARSVRVHRNAQLLRVVADPVPAVALHPFGSVETVGVAGLVDLMNLLAAWTPVVQAAYVCDEAAERWRKENGH